MSNDGGPAFPARPTEHLPSGGTVSAHNGMSLRDWFAGQALQGMIANPNNSLTVTIGQMATDAYCFAGAMLAARACPPRNALAVLDELDRLRAENAELREALKPFANYAAYLDSGWANHSDDTIVAGPLESNMTFGDFRRARKALETK